MSYLITLLALCTLTACGYSGVKPQVVLDTPPTLSPDYSGATIPLSIAPLNFSVKDSAAAYCVELAGSDPATTIILRNDHGRFVFPIKEWRTLLAQSAGDSITIRTSLYRNDRWEGLQKVSCPVSPDAMDSHLVYRLLRPSYTQWSTMGIYQRDLTSFDQEVILDNSANDRGCVNCHTFSANEPDRMMLHLRKNKGGTVISTPKGTKKYTTKVGSMIADAVYPSWSRDGRFIAFSTNDTKQVFHLTGSHKPIEVIDLRSDLVVLDLEHETMLSDSCVRSDRYWETYPEWSAAGDWVYFCRADTVETTPSDGTIMQARYDLCRVAFDQQKAQITGPVQVLYAAAEKGKSVSFPKISPDGRWLVFTLSDYGNFSIWHPESDLYLMDLENGQIKAIDRINSPSVDSYHSWSSNGRWLVLSSKRMDGLWATPFVAHFDPESGVFGKPFAIPQPSADFYEHALNTFNIPQFVTAPITSTDLLIEAVNAEPQLIKKGVGL